MMFSKQLLSLLSTVFLGSSSLLGVSYPLPTPIGSPVPIDPQVSFPDPILANLPLVMDNHFQPPWYPGNFLSPTYLKDVYYATNAFIGSDLIFNPFDDKMVLLTVGQNQVIDLKGIFYPVMVGTNTIAVSHDGGDSWNYGPPAEQIIPLGGTVSQLINASIGPGLYLQYAKDGTLHATGWGFFDMVANAPHLDPLSGFLSTTSQDNGLTWTPPLVLWPTTADAWFNTTYNNRGPLGTRTRNQEFYTTVDPSNSQIIHACTTTYSTATAFDGPRALFGPYGRISYLRSEDGGKTFSAPVEIYTLSQDPKWLTEFINPDYGADSEYLNVGGCIGCNGPPIVVDDNVVLIPVIFFLVDKNRTSLYGQTSGFGALRSTDGGKTWSKSLEFITSDLKSPPFGYDPGVVDGSVPVLINGHYCFPFFLDGTAGFSRSPQGQGPGVVSPSTGRIYLIRAGYRENADVSVTHLGTLNQGGTAVVVTSSSDKGNSWTPLVEVSRTPRDILFGAQQTLSYGAAISEDGWYAVAYYDFRNWQGYPGEIYDNIDPLTAPPLQTDAWLAIYKETLDPLGGSTGIGLDFVGEIRLTEESFNGRAAFMGTTVPYSFFMVTGTPELVPIGFNNKNELFVLFSTQTPGSPLNIDPNNYKGMTIDTNGYFNLFLQRFKFPKPSNQ